MSGEESVIQAYEHAVKMAQDVTRPAYESLQWAAKAEAYAFALCQYSQDLTGPGGLVFWHEQALWAYRLGRQRLTELRTGYKEAG
jgi:hypothetical protein